MSPDLRCGDWREVLADVTVVDAVIVDAPYSARTHGEHDGSVGRGGKRRTINYAKWTPDDVRAFCDAWTPRCRGWVVTITDHVLAPVWSAALAAHDRYVFAPLPWVANGSRVRLTGDGPSSWTCWIVVARPRSGEDRNGRPFCKWGTLPGAYVIGAKNHATLACGAQQHRVVGGKPLALMRALVRDYTRPGDLVVDPCAGGGTTLLAAAQEGRRAIGSELDPETHAKAVERIRRELRQGDLWTAPERTRATQEDLL